MTSIKGAWEFYLSSIQKSGIDLEPDIIDCLKTAFYAGAYSVFQVGPTRETYCELQEFCEQSYSEVQEWVKKSN